MLKLGVVKSKHKLSRALCLVFALLIFVNKPLTVSAAIPSTINYQGVLKSNLNIPIVVATTIQFSIYTTAATGLPTDIPSASGPLLWTETYNAGSGSCAQITPNSQGQFATRLGSCNSFPSYLDFSNQYYLGIKIGSNSEATPRVVFSSVPYSENVRNIVFPSNQANAFSAADTLGNNYLNFNSTIGNPSINLTQNTSIGNNTKTLTIGAVIQGGIPLVFEGSTVDANKTSLQVADPTGNRIITLPDNSGTVAIGVNPLGPLSLNALGVLDCATCLTTATTPDLQQVTTVGNITTNSIQFAGGLSTQPLTVQKTLTPFSSGLEPIIIVNDSLTTNQGIVLGKYNNGFGDDISALAFSNNLGANPSSTTSVAFEYSHANNNLLIRNYSSGSFLTGLSVGDVLNFETTQNQGFGPSSAFNFTNYGTLKGVLSFSNPSSNIDLFMATGSPEGNTNANSSSLYFRTDSTGLAPHLYLKTTDGVNTGWAQVATINDLTVSNPGGSDRQIQFNNAGTFGGASNLSYVANNLELTAANNFEGFKVLGNPNYNFTLNRAGFLTESNNTPGNFLQLQFSDPSGGNYLQVPDASGTLARIEDLVGLGYWEKAGSALYPINYNTDDVGIGTNTPAARLHVLGGTVLFGGNSGEEIFKVDPLANNVSLGDFLGWNSGTKLVVDDGTRNIDLTAGSSVNGGNINFTGGTGGTGSGGGFLFTGGNSNDSTGGIFEVYAGSSATDQGGYIGLYSGNGETSGGNFVLSGGYGNTIAGGKFQLLAGNSNTGNGGDFEMFAGNSNTANGGDFTLSAGIGPGGSGAITLSAGSSFAGGFVNINSATGSSATSATQLRFVEAQINGGQYVAFKSPNSLSSSTVYTLPQADGTLGQSLVTDGFGNLSWASGGTGGTLNDAYNFGGPAAGRVINAVATAGNGVEIRTPYDPLAPFQFNNSFNIVGDGSVGNSITDGVAFGKFNFGPGNITGQIFSSNVNDFSNTTFGYQLFSSTPANEFLTVGITDPALNDLATINLSKNGVNINAADPLGNIDISGNNFFNLYSANNRISLTGLNPTANEAAVTMFNNNGVDPYQVLSLSNTLGSVFQTVGAVLPEAIVNAPTGSIYFNTAATNVADALFVKTGGFNTTGWLSIANGASGWGFAGNSILGTEVLGTTNAKDLNIISNGSVGGTAGAGALNIGDAQTGSDTLISLGSFSTSATSQTINIGANYGGGISGFQTMNIGSNGNNALQQISIGDASTSSFGQFLSFGSNANLQAGAISQSIDIGSTGTFASGVGQSINIGYNSSFDGGIQNIRIGGANVSNGGSNHIFLGGTVANIANDIQIVTPRVRMEAALQLGASTYPDQPTGGPLNLTFADSDYSSMYVVNQTTPGQTITLTTPTVSGTGTLAFVQNTGTAAFNSYGQTILPGEGRNYVWNGSAWAPQTGTSGGGGGTLDQAYNFGGPGLGKDVNINSGAIDLTVSDSLGIYNALTITGDTNTNQGVLFGKTNFGSGNQAAFGFADDVNNPAVGDALFANYNFTQNRFNFALRTGGTTSTDLLMGNPLIEPAGTQFQNYTGSSNILSLAVFGVGNIVQNVGAGSPEGVTTADSGSVFYRVDGTGGSEQLYVKTTDGTNTGWVALGSAGGALSTADNGLTVNPAGNVQLGGILGQNTFIDGNGGTYDFTIQDIKSFSIGGGGVGAIGDIANTTLRLIGSDELQIKTPLVNSNLATNGFILTLQDATTGRVEYTDPTLLPSSGWALVGNAGTTPGTNFIGTTDNTDLVFKTNNAMSGLIANDGLSVAFGLNAGVGASRVNTNFFGQNAGNGAVNASGSNFFGFNSGNNATNANNSNFFGTGAGNGATSASASSFFGENAGNGATNAIASNFFGPGAGQTATAASNSNFFGQNTGQAATNASSSNFFGPVAGAAATNASNSNFFGNSAGINATDASNANFLGSNAGNSAAFASYANFFGASAGNNAVFASNSNFLGASAGNNATNASDSNFFGNDSGSSATDADHSNFFGLSSGLSATNARYSNFIGANAGNSATNATLSNFIGNAAGFNASESNNSNFIGTNAGSQANKANNSNFIGASAGESADNAFNSTFIGNLAGFKAQRAANSIFIGNNAGFGDTVNNTSSGTSILIGDNTGTGGFSNSIALGANAVNTTNDQFMVADTYVNWRVGGIDYIVPSAQGNLGDVLTNNGSGTLSWAPAGSGSITADNGLTINPVGNVQLGGALLGATSINNAAGKLSIANGLGAGSTFYTNGGFEQILVAQNNFANDYTTAIYNDNNATSDDPNYLFSRFWGTKYSSGNGVNAESGFVPYSNDGSYSSAAQNTYLGGTNGSFARSTLGAGFVDPIYNLIVDGGSSTISNSAINLTPQNVNLSYNDTNFGRTSSVDLSVNGSKLQYQDTTNSWLTGVNVDSTSGTPKVRIFSELGSYTLPRNHGSASQVLTDDGSGFLYWAAPGGTPSVPLSSVTAATTSVAFNNAANSIGWQWNTLTTQNAMAFDSSSVTTGTILRARTFNAGLNSTNGIAYIANEGSSTNGMLLRARSNVDANSGLSVLANGKVGIGNVAPALQLDVTDTTTTSVAIFNGSGATQCTVVSGTGLSCTSDARLKNNVQEINNYTNSSALDLLQQLRPVTYNWINGSDQTQYGFIAQEVEQVIPGLVTNAENGYKSLNTIGMIPFITQAVKEQQTQINSLTDQVKNSPSQEVPVVNNNEITANVIAQLLASGNLTFAGNVLIQGDLVVNGSTTLAGEFILNNNYAGNAVIKSGFSSLQISFAKPFTITPVINLTPLGITNSKYAVTNISKTGFIIQLDSVQTQDTSFNWSAVVVKDILNSSTEAIPAIVPPAADSQVVVPVVEPQTFTQTGTEVAPN